MNAIKPISLPCPSSTVTASQHPPDRHAGAIHLVAGYNKWRDDFHRNVRKGEKAIRNGPGPVQGEKGSAKAGRTGQAGDGKSTESLLPK